jgi:cob(I)alamin adenosyltransferase
MGADGTDSRVLILTGPGKGKTTSALGTALRAVGHGMRVLFLQFVKAEECGEHRAAERLGGLLQMRLAGTGFIDTSDPECMARAREAAARALAEAAAALASGDYGLVVLDEVIFAVDAGLLVADDVRAAVEGRARGTHVVLTGRGDAGGLADLADTITCMEDVKHAHAGGTAATPGIEF